MRPARAFRCDLYFGGDFSEVMELFQRLTSSQLAAAAAAFMRGAQLDRCRRSWLATLWNGDNYVKKWNLCCVGLRDLHVDVFNFGGENLEIRAC